MIKMKLILSTDKISGGCHTLILDGRSKTKCVNRLHYNFMQSEEHDFSVFFLSLRSLHIALT